MNKRQFVVSSALVSKRNRLTSLIPVPFNSSLFSPGAMPNGSAWACLQPCIVRGSDDRSRRSCPLPGCSRALDQSQAVGVSHNPLRAGLAWKQSISAQIDLGSVRLKRPRAATGGLKSTAGRSRRYGAGPVQSSATSAAEITWSSVYLGKSANGNYFGRRFCEIHG